MILNQLKFGFLMSLFTLQIAVKAQVYEPFNQTVHQLKSKWNFTDSCFWVNPKNQLQSQVLAKNISEIYANIFISSGLQSNQWSSSIAFDFNPSSQNQVRFYLYADSMNFSKSTNALFIQFGGINGTDDLIELVQINENSKQVLASSLPGFVKSNNNQFRFKCTVDSIQQLTLAIDTVSFSRYNQIFKCSVSTIPSNFYTGYWFKFTSSNANRLILDDFYYGKELINTQQVKLVSSALVSDSCLQFTWDGAIDTSNFIQKMTCDFGAASYCMFSSTHQTVAIFFNHQLSKIAAFEICLEGLYSNQGKTITDTCLSWNQYNINTLDIRFSELMIDPDPVIGLPNAEFIELYNQTDYAFNLNRFLVTDLHTAAELGNYILYPHTFVVICAKKDSAKFDGIPLHCVPSLPSLNNLSDTLELYSKHQLLLDQVNYNTNWYHCNPIPNGGRSLCLINANSNCLPIENWRASGDSSGGSPGFSGVYWNTSIDTMKLELLQFTALDSIHLLLVFNKALLSIDFNSVGLQTRLIWQSLGGDSFLFSTDPLNANQTFSFQLSRTCACNYNCLDTAFNYSYVPLKNAFYNDLVFSELLFEPIANAPTQEFIELYNKSQFRIQLSGYQICKGNQCIVLPFYEWYPDSFVVLTKTPILGLKNQLVLPKLFSLNLTDTLLIRNKENLLVSFLPYSQSFYHDLFKQTQKGWSVECMNLELPCKGQENWHASVNESKHTAGLRNSMVQFTVDTIAPQLNKLYPIDAFQLLLAFNEPIDTGFIDAQTQISIKDHTMNWHFENNTQTLILDLFPPLQKNKLYELTINQLPDCVGNGSIETSYLFALPDKIDTGELLLNEVLFDPVIGGSDFIELYNHSAQYLDLKSVYFGFKSAQDAQLKELCTVAPQGYLLAPNDYVIITTSDQSNFFSEVNSAKQVFINLPNLSNDGGWLELLTKEGNCIDAMPYNQAMHFQLLPNFEGVSLERLSLNISASNAENWFSASAQERYATPTRKNSMRLLHPPLENRIAIAPEVFSPDNDGYDDLLQINYQFNQLESFSELSIFNLHGFRVKDFAKSYWGGSQGLWIWNGLDNENNPLPEGFYVVKLTVFMPDGTLDIHRKTLVLARRDRN